MNTFWKVSLAFASGLIIGGFATKKYIEYKDNQYYVEEIVEEEYEENETEVEEIKKAEDNIVKERVNYNKIKSVNDEEYNRLLNELKYTSEQEAMEILGDMVYTDNPTQTVDENKPYNISQDDFEDLDGYDSDEYTYYSDGYVTDSYGMPISEEDIVNTIGEDFDSYFGTYDDNQIWVRNEHLKMDFSVIKDLDKFVDVATPRIKRMVGL